MKITTMKTKHTRYFAAAALIGTLAFTTNARAAKPATSGQPNADQILRQMSDTLAGARQFTFKAHRTMDPALVPAGVLSDVRIEAAIQRPNRLVAHSKGRHDSRQFVFDGRSFTLLDEKNNFYATVPMRTTIDELVEAADEVYGFTLPVAEFVLSNPYKDLRQQAHTISYLGHEKLGGFLGIGGTECHRLALTGKLADAELWVGVVDHLPRKLVATFKNHPDKPQLKVEFSSWNLAAATPAAGFSFVPPKGAMKIEMQKKR